MSVRLLALAIASLIWATAANAQTVRITPDIVDGDTVHAGDLKIRIDGVDAPETDQACKDSRGDSWLCGLEARKKLAEFSNRRTWICKLGELDLYGRRISTCSIDGQDVGSWLVQSGWALAFRRYSLRYIADEQIAREKSAGLWSGTFIAPWDWRSKAPQTEVLGVTAKPSQLLGKNTAQAASGCKIKGNLEGSGGQCIYHVPGGRYYETLSMEKQARRWFCSEAEAQSAGCRRSKL